MAKTHKCLLFEQMLHKVTVLLLEVKMKHCLHSFVYDNLLFVLGQQYHSFVYDNLLFVLGQQYHSFVYDNLLFVLGQQYHSFLPPRYGVQNWTVVSCGDDVISRQARCRIPAFWSPIRHYIGSNI